MIEQSIKDMCRVSHSGIDGLDVIRPVLIGQMSVEGNARVVAIFGIHLAGSFAATTGPEALTVGRRSGSFPPVPSKRHIVLIIDEFGERLRVRFISNVPRTSQESFAKLVPGQDSAIFPRPKLVASARMAVNNRAGSFDGSSVLRWAK